MTKRKSIKVKKVKKPYKEKELKVYILWRSLPVILRTLSIGELEDLGFDTSDPVFMKLISIRTKTQFALEFGTSKEVLSRWEKNDGFQKQLTELCKKNNVLKFEQEIDFRFTKKTLKNAEPAYVKLWKQIYTGWQERGGVADEALTKSIDELTKTIREIAEM